MEVQQRNATEHGTMSTTKGLVTDTLYILRKRKDRKGQTGPIEDDQRFTALWPSSPAMTAADHPDLHTGCG